MSRKRSILAVILALIVCLILFPTAAIAEDGAASSEANPAPAVVEEAPVEPNGSEPAEDPAPVQNESPAPVENPTGTEDTAVYDSAENKVEESETLVEQTVEVQSEMINGEVKESEDVVTVPETHTGEDNKPVEHTPAEEPIAEADSSAQIDKTVSPPNTAEAVSTESEEIELDLSQGDVKIEDTGDESTGIIKITSCKDSSGTSLSSKTVANGSTIRVKQNGESAISKVISVIFKKAQSFVNLILDSLNIKNSSKASIDIQTAADSTVALELDGDNTVKTDASDYAALQKSGDGTLVIKNENDTAGSLYAEQLTGSNGAAIGGGYGSNVGSIVISGAEVTAATKKMSASGAAIGAGYDGSVKEIRIENNAIVNATSGGNGAAIGASETGSAGSITINNSKVTATGNGYGAAIGGGKQEKGKVDAITIENNSNVTATNTGRGAGIGAGQYGAVGTITIDHSEVHAYGDGTGARGAGIGGGQNGSVETIVINNNSNVEAEGDYYAAAIGGGQKGTVDSIAISDSTVKATSNGNGAALGGGQDASVGSITIDNSTVEAHEENGNIYSAALGGGQNSSVESIAIKGESTIYAIGNWYAVKGDVDTSGLEGAVIIDDEYEYYTKKVTPEPTPDPTPDPTPEPTPTPVPVIVIDPPKDENTDEQPEPPAPFIPKKDTPVEEKKDTLVESKKDDDVVHSAIVIEDTTAKITVTDNNGEQIDPKEVTIKSVAAFEETGAAEASIQLTQKLIVNVDVETMKEAAAKSNTDGDAVTVTNEDSVITVKSGETALVSVEVKAVVAATEETVTVKFNRNTVRVICGNTAYHIDLTDLGDLGTLTLRLENGVLKIYDKDGNLLKEVTSV